VELRVCELRVCELRVCELRGLELLVPPPPWNFPAGIEDPSTLNRLTDRLVQRGHSDDEIRGVLGENWMRVFNQIWSKE
jgi:microsomal dipeptidase-like Zn-dependent dipeptidase